MRVHALLERRDRIMRSRRHRQCNSRKRSTLFGNTMVSNLQFVRANKTLRLKRSLSNLSSISRNSLTPSNSPPPRPQTSIIDACVLESKEDNEEGHSQQLEIQKSPETHKLKIRTVFQRHKMQQLRNHQEAMTGNSTVEENSKISLTLDKSPSTLLKNGHLVSLTNSCSNRNSGRFLYNIVLFCYSRTLYYYFKVRFLKISLKVLIPEVER